MGGNSSSNGGGGREAQSVNQYEQERKRREEKARQRELAASKGGGVVLEKERKEFIEAGAEKIKKQTEEATTPLAAKVLSGGLQKGSKITREYFKGEVLGKGAYKGTDVASFEAMSRAGQEKLYGEYIKGRTSGKTDAYGRTLADRGDTRQASMLGSPTTAEVSQSQAIVAEAPKTMEAEKIADTEEQRKRKTLRRGRSLTIFTGPRGATGGLTLGIPSLLGR